MQCERAQEFFSDYVERALDRPMTVALEGHLVACRPCRDEVESLRETFLTLEATPEIEPPVDGVWHVMCRLQQERAAKLEAERNRRPGFVEWLRSLSPASVAMGASLATLVIGGTWFATGIPHGQSGPFTDFTPAPLAAPPAVAPSLQVSYGPLSTSGQLVRLRLVPSTPLASPQVRVTGASLSVDFAVRGTVGPNTPAEFPINLPTGSPAEALRLTAVTQDQKLYDYTVVVPLTRLKDQPVTVSFQFVALADALRRLAPHVGRAVVVDGGIEGNVSLQVDEQSPKRCLDSLADQVGAVVKYENDVYRLTRTP